MKSFAGLFLILLIPIISIATDAKGNDELIWKGDFNNRNWFRTWRKKGRFVYLNTNLWKIASESDTEPHLEVLHRLGSYSKRDKPGGFHFRLHKLTGTKVTFSYKVKFEKGFRFGKGGKLPGLGGGRANTGGRIPNGKDGFSIRYMWRQKGRLYLYCYLPTSIRHGTYFDTGVDLATGRWQSIKQTVTLNDPMKPNGSISTF